jgi:glycosyltransferase involved in cell wall biosynthesis
VVDLPPVFEGIGVRALSVSDLSPEVCDRRASRVASAARALASVPGAGRRVLRLLHGEAAERRRSYARLSHARASILAFAREWPTLLACRRMTARERRAGRRPVVLWSSSYVRPYWLKPALLGQPVVEQAFEAPSVPEHPPLRRLRPRVAATTGRVAAEVRRLVPGAAVVTLSHFPVPTPPGRVDPTCVGPDLRTALGPWIDAGVRWGLFYGVMHGKKDLHTVIRAGALLPPGLGLALVGDPAHDGRALPAELRRLLDDAPGLVHLFRPTTDDERRWLFDHCAAVVLAQQRGTASMSGSLVDAIAHGRPVVATGDTATGDLTARAGLGATYEAGDERSLAAALVALTRRGAPFRPDREALAGAGVLPAQEWARRLLHLATDGEPPPADRPGAREP